MEGRVGPTNDIDRAYLLTGLSTLGCFRNHSPHGGEPGYTNNESFGRMPIQIVIGGSVKHRTLKDILDPHVIKSTTMVVVFYSSG